MNVVEGTPPSSGTPAPEPTLVGTPPVVETPPTDPKVEPPAPEPEPFIPLTADDITFPEGVTVNEGLRDSALAIINDREKSPKEQLQSLVDLQVKAAQEASEASSHAWTEMQTKWQDEVKADPEIGGEKLPATLGRISRLISEYGSDELVGAFDLTGAGNNPHIIRFLDKVAGKLTEGVPATGTPVAQQATAAERMFPSMKGQ